MSIVDLHTHTNASDGTYSPSELIDYAVKKGLSAIAITDHDTIDGIDEAFKRAKYHKDNGYNIEVIPGIEFSTDYMGFDVHIVGLYVDYNSPYFKERLLRFKESRNKRNEKMCELLTAHGMPITYEELKKEYPSSAITRAHYGKMLLKKGYIKSISEAFDRYIGDHKPCHVPRKMISPIRAVEIIRKAGGFPILAHPVLYGFSKEKLEGLIKKLKGAGLMGIEAIYSTYTPSDERTMRTLAAKYDMSISGGSDFHGSNKPDIDLATGKGHLYIPSSVLDSIKISHKRMLETNDNYMIRKILFTDLDGTLLRSDKTISDYTKDVLNKWIKAGHFFSLCSGRDIQSVNSVLASLKLDSYDNVYTIGFNGGIIYDPNNKEIVHSETLNISDVDYLYNKARQMGLYFQTYDNDHFIVPYDGKETAYYTKVIKTPYEVCENITSRLKTNPYKCLIIELDNLDKVDEFVSEMTPWCSLHNISLMYSNPNYLEIIPSSSGKGAAIKHLTRHLNIDGLISIAAGDEQNDLSMLKEADIAIAMLNGIDLLKDISTTISDKSCEEDGLALTIENMI